MADDAACRLEDHACRSCLGPIISRGERFECAVCGAAAEGSPTDICGCGIVPKGPSKRPGHFRCVLNPRRTPANPARVLIAFAAAEPSKASAA